MKPQAQAEQQSLKTEKVEKNNMAKTFQETAIETIKSDSKETAKRLAVIKTSKILQDGIVKTLTQDLKGNKKNETKLF